MYTMKLRFPSQHEETITFPRATPTQEIIDAARTYSHYPCHVVIRLDGSIVGCANGGSVSALAGSALFNYLSAEQLSLI